MEKQGVTETYRLIEYNKWSCKGQKVSLRKALRTAITECSYVLFSRQSVFVVLRLFLSLLFICMLIASAEAAEQRYNIPIGNSPQKGPSDAPVTIIEFLDFQ